MSDENTPSDPSSSRVDDANCHSSKIGRLRLGVAGESQLRWAAVDIAVPLEEARQRLDLSPVAAVALGRSLAAIALLQRFTIKSPGRLALDIAGDGPLGKIHTEVDEQGYLRGLVGEPRLATPDDGSLAIGWAVGQGLFKVTRVTERGRYESQVKMVSGEIGKDLVHFLEQSQQIRSAALLGVLPKPTGIAQAGGVLIEAFPGTSDDLLTHLESNITSMGGISQQLDSGGLKGLLDAVLDGLDQDELESHELRYGCGRGRESLLQKLAHLSQEDIDSIVDEKGCFVADCSYCGRRYEISRDELGPVAEPSVN